MQYWGTNLGLSACQASITFEVYAQPSKAFAEVSVCERYRGSKEPGLREEGILYFLLNGIVTKGIKVKLPHSLH